jgi:histone H3/H4
MPSVGEIKSEMKKTTDANITKSAVEEMISFYEEFIINSLKDDEKIAIDKGEKTVGISPGLSSSKIMSFSRNQTKLKISSSFVEKVKFKLCEKMKIITKRAEGLAIDEGRKSISGENVKQSINEINSTGKYEIEDDDITPYQIEGSAQRELGVISDESVEVISGHLSYYLGQVYNSILTVANERGRNKGNIKIEDVMDAVSRIKVYCYEKEEQKDEDE